MRVAMIGQKGIPSRAGGVEIHVEEISRRLEQKNVEVFAYCRRGYCREDEISGDRYQGVYIRFTPYIHSKHLDAITHTFFSTLAALKDGCQIFHYHALGPSTLAFIPRILGKRVVCTVHGLDWQRGKWGGFASRFLKFGEFATAHFADRTINVSKNLVGYYQKKYGVETTHIPNGICRPTLAAAELITEKFGLRKDKYILFLARLVPEKGAHYLIKAFRTIADNDMKLVIAGGSSHSQDYADSLIELAGGDSRIIFTGFVEGQVLRELYSNAYVYVLPSDIEGHPISLLEAMSYGNCCIVSDIAENTDVISQAGISFTKGDPSDLRRAITQCMTDKKLVLEIKEKSAEYVIEKYNWNYIAELTNVVYTSLIHEV